MSSLIAKIDALAASQLCYICCSFSLIIPRPGGFPLSAITAITPPYSHTHSDGSRRMLNFLKAPIGVVRYEIRVVEHMANKKECPNRLIIGLWLIERVPICSYKKGLVVRYFIVQGAIVITSLL